MNKQFFTTGITFLLIGISLASIICINVIALPGSIEVHSPAHDSYFFEGEILTVIWDYSNDTGNWVIIELYYDGYFLNTITSNTSNDGHYSWTIPLGYSSTSYFQIKVKSVTHPSASDFSGSFYIQGKQITVTTPSGGDTWFAGETYEIIWQTDYQGDFLKIEYIIDSNVYTIDSYAANSGYYYWTIPSQLYPSSSYQIKISSLYNSNVYAYSDYFSIGGRSISITSPQGGEIWYSGETYTISWFSTNIGDYVDIDYKRGSSYFYTRIAAGIQNDGKYEWTIPWGISWDDQYTIKITSKSFSDVYIISNYFSIDQRYININSPRWYDKWYPNETYNIKWESENAGDYLDIRLFKNEVYCASIAKNINNTGSYSWTISDIFTPSSDYQIEIRSKTYSNLYKFSDWFSISGRSIEIHNPCDGDWWFTEDVLEIDWESENAGHSVFIELFKDGEQYKTIDPKAENTGRYYWEIPSELPPGSYQIKITGLPYGEVSSFSKGNFTIDQNFGQKYVPYIFIFIIIIVTIAAARKIIIKIRGRKQQKPGENLINSQQEIRTTSQISQGEIAPEDYDKIWEGNKH